MNILMLGPSLDERGGIGEVETLIINTVPDEFEIQHICTWDGEPSQSSKLHMLQVFGRSLIDMGWKLWHDRIDRVHIHMSERGSVARTCILSLMAFAARKPTIVHTHGSEFHLFYEKLPQPLQRSLNWILQHCSYMIVLSESWKDFYIKKCGLNPEQTVVLLNPVDIPERLEKSESSEPLKFLFMGKITQRKGIFELLHAFAKLPPATRKKAELIVAGTGEMERCYRLVETLNIQERVKFLGWVTGEQRTQQLATADMFVLPSYNEGLPMALLEAMGWGLAPITTPVGGIPELLRDLQTGLMVEPGDIQQLSVAMQALIEDESLRGSLGRAARNRVAPLDINNYINTLGELYQLADGKQLNRFTAVRNPQGV